MKTYCISIRAYLICVSLLLTTYLYAQPTPDQYAQYDLSNRYVAPASPEATSLGKYGDLPVNKYTGTTNVPIPITTIGGAFVSMPVSINYATGGIKVDQSPTVVGLGWALSAGGSVTRSVRHIPDNQLNYFDQAQEIEDHVDAFNTGQDEIEYNDFYSAVARDEIETIPDIYFYSFNGRSGKFYISPRKKIVQMEDSDVEIIPDFNAQGEINKFTIYDETGVRYTYAQRDMSDMQLDDVVKLPNGMPQATYQYTYTSTWHLTEIKSVGVYETIEIQYTDANPSIPLINQNLYKSRIFSELTEYCGGQSTMGTLTNGSPPQTYVINNSVIDTVRVMIHNQEKERLSFHYSSASQTYDVAGSQQLDYIDHDRTNPNDGTWSNFLRYRFEYNGSTGGRLTLRRFGPTAAGSNAYL